MSIEGHLIGGRHRRVDAKITPAKGKSWVKIWGDEEYITELTAAFHSTAKKPVTVEVISSD